MSARSDSNALGNNESPVSLLCQVTANQATKDADFFINIHLLFHQEDGRCTFAKTIRDFRITNPIP